MDERNTIYAKVYLPKYFCLFCAPFNKHNLFDIYCAILIQFLQKLEVSFSTY
jgi:hypothetical protein